MTADRRVARRINAAYELLEQYSRTGDESALARVMTEFTRLEESGLEDPQERVATLIGLGNVALERFRLTGDQADLDTSIRSGGQVLELLPDDSRWRSAALSNLAGALRSRFDLLTDLGSLSSAIAYLREGVTLAAERGSADLSNVLYNLGGALLQLHEAQPDPALVEEALAHRKEGLRLTLPEDPFRPQSESGYAQVLLARFRLHGITDDLQEAVGHAAVAVRTIPPDHPKRVLLARRLWDALAEEQPRTIEDLDQLIDGLRLVLTRMPESQPERPDLLYMIMQAEYARHTQMPREPGPAALVEDCRRLAEAMPVGNELRLNALFIAGTACLHWSQATGDQPILDEAVDLCQRVVAEIPVTSPRRSTVYSWLGIVLQSRYGARGNPADMDSAITAAIAAIDNADADDPERPDFSTRLGQVLLDRYGCREEIEDLNAAVRHFREALSVTGQDDQALAGRRSNLASSLRIRFRAQQQTEDLDEAIDLAQMAAEATATDHPRRALYLSTLSGIMLERYRLAEALEDLAASVAAAEQALGSVVSVDDRIVVTAQYTTTLTEQFKHSRELPDIEKAIKTVRRTLAECELGGGHREKLLHLLVQALAACSRDSEEYIAAREDLVAAHFGSTDDLNTELLSWSIPDASPEEQANLLTLFADTLERRYLREGRPDRLATIIEVRRRAEAVGAMTGHDRSTCTTARLAGTLRLQFEQDGDLLALDQAVEISKRALGQPSHANHKMELLAGLGAAQVLRFERFHAEGDLAEAFNAFDLALENSSDDALLRAFCVSERAIACKLRYQRSGDPHDAEYAIAAHSDLASQALEGSPEHVLSLVNLTSILAARAQQEPACSEADLLKADAWSREALALAPEGHPLHSRALVTRAQILALRIGRTRDPDALEELRLLNFTAAATDGAGILSDLIPSLYQAFLPVGDRNFSDAAIAAARGALETVSQDHPAYAGLLTNLANCLYLRFDRTGELGDIEEAIEAVQRAIAAEPGEAQHYLVFAMLTLGRHEHTGGRADLDAAVTAGRRALELSALRPGGNAGAMNNLANALRRRFQVAGDISDLEAAVALANEVVSISRDPMILHNIRLIRSARFGGTGDAADANAAIAAAEEALDATQAGQVSRPLLLSGLGAAYDQRYRLARDPEDLEKAIRYGGEAIAVMPNDDVDRARLLVNYGFALTERGNTADLIVGRDAFREAAQTAQARIWVRVDAARAWGHSAAQAEDWADAVRGYSEAVSLLPRFASPSLGRDDQENNLALISGLASSAAAAALNDDDPEKAVLLLEQARGVLFAQALEGHDDLADLETEHPDLAAELRELQKRLDPAHTGATTWEASQHRRQDAARWDELLANTRQLPGQRYFLRPPSIWELTDEASGGPLVYVNVSGSRSDALIVRPNGVTVVPLAPALIDELHERSGPYIDALNSMASEVGAFLAANQEVMRMLNFLWDTVVEPVLSELGFARATGPDLPRLWWLPAGWLSILPFHAAGYHDGSGRSALEQGHVLLHPDHQGAPPRQEAILGPSTRPSPRRGDGAHSRRARSPHRTGRGRLRRRQHRQHPHPPRPTGDQRTDPRRATQSAVGPLRLPRSPGHDHPLQWPPGRTRPQ